MSSDFSTVIFASGGTGGHIYPALETARELAKRAPKLRIIFYGAGTATEKKIFATAEFEHRIVAAKGVVGGGASGVLRFILTLPIELIKLVSAYRKARVSVVVGYGGYPSVFPMLAALFLRKPTIVFEQNACVGLANRWLSRFASKVFAVRDSLSQLPSQSVAVRNPIRRNLLELPPYKVSPDGYPLRVLVVGGSQGALTLNKVIVGLSKKQLQITLRHQTGKRDFPEISNQYSELDNFSAEEYIDDMHEAYSWADVIICRAGATTVAEIIAGRRPAIFFPLVIAEGHQRENIQGLLRANAACVIEHGDQELERLEALLLELSENRNKLIEMHQQLNKYAQENDAPDGAERISEEILSLISAQ